MGAFHSVAVNANEGISEMRSGLMPKMKEISTKLSEYLNLQHLGDKLKEKITIDRVVAVVLSIVNLWRYRDTADILTNITILLCQFGIVESVVFPLVGWLAEKLVGLKDVWKARRECVEPQGKIEDFKNWFEEFKEVAADKTFSIIGVIMKTISTGQLPSEKFNNVLDSWSKEARKWWNVKQGAMALTSIVDWIVKCITWIFDKIAGYEEPRYRQLREIERHAPCVSEWARAVLEYDCDFVYRNLGHDPAVQNKIMQLAEKAYQYTEIFCVRDAPAVVVNMIKDVSRIIMKMRRLVEQARKTSFGRKEPFAVYLAGESGVGKTHYGECLLHELCSVYAHPTANRVYSRLPHTEYWDGYNGARGVLFDDLGQERDKETDITEWFRAKAPAVFIVPKAAVEEKGQAFESEFMVATSNTMFPRPRSISCYEALWRRRDVAAWVRVKDQYRKRGSQQLDPCKATDGFEFLEFHILDDPCREQPMPEDGNWMNERDFKEYVIRCSRAFRKHQERLMEAKEQRYQAQPQAKTEDVDFSALKTIGGYDTMMLKHVLRDGQRVLFPYTPENHEGIEKRDWDIIWSEWLAFKVAPPEEQQQVLTQFDDWQATMESKQDRSPEDIKKKVRTFGQVLRDWIHGMYPKIWKLIKLAGKIGLWALYTAVHMFIISLGIYGGMYAFTKLVNWWHGEESPEDQIEVSQPETYPSGDERTKQLQRKVIRTGLPEGSSDVNAMQVVNNKVIPNMVRVRRVVDDVSMEMNAFGVLDRIYMLPKHFFYYKGKVLSNENSSPVIFVQRGGEWIPIPFDSKCLYCHPDKDLALYMFPSTLSAVKKVNHLFIKEEMLSVKATFEGQLVVLSDTPVCKQLLVNAIDAPVHSANDHFNIMIRTGWMYKAQTLAGECGGILVAFDGSLPLKLVGMHVAGKCNDSLGFSEVVTQEILDSMMNKLFCQKRMQLIEGVTIPQYDSSPQALEKIHISPDGDFTIIGLVPKKDAPWQPFKTNIKPSLIFGKVREHVTEPSVLHPSDPRLEVPVSPLCLGISKYGTIQMPFPVDDLEAAGKYLKKIAKFVSRRHARLLTDYEVINGNENVKYLDAMNMQSSPGYPYVMEKKKGKGKTWMFSGEPGAYELIHIGARDTLMRREYFAKQGIRINSVWLDCLKDERRSIEKVKNGKTRVFTIPPVDYTMLARKYFLMFCVAFYEARLQLPSAVGIDCESFEWSEIYHKLRSCSDSGFDGDFASFDGTMDPILMRMAIDAINEWYDDKQENQRVRVVLGDEMIHTIQIATNCCYMTHRGNPSGNPLTVVINSMVNMAYMYIMWRLIMKVNGQLDLMNKFDQKVKYFVYGDDNIVAVSKSVEHLYNFENVSKMFSYFGYRYTAADKTSTYRTRPLKELTFLKRGFRQHPLKKAIWIPTMKLDTIYELLNWIRESDDDIAALYENIEDAFKFAYFHGEEFFDQLLRDVNRALRMSRLSEVPYSYGDCEMAFMGKIV